MGNSFACKNNKPDANLLQCTENINSQDYLLYSLPIRLSLHRNTKIKKKAWL
jgi:hypothetical protein